MTPDRWKRIEEIYHSARGCAPADRAAYLAEAYRLAAVSRHAGISGVFFGRQQPDRGHDANARAAVWRPNNILGIEHSRGLTKTYQHFSDMTDDVVVVRIYQGIHFRPRMRWQGVKGLAPPTGP
jgi:hypothetical protein